MKWLLILLLIGCSSTVTMNSRLVKDEVKSIRETSDGNCEYMVEPKHSRVVYVKDECYKYDIGDSLYRVEVYTIEK